MINLRNLTNIIRIFFKIFFILLVLIFFIAESFAALPKKIYGLTLKELSQQISALSDEEEALLEEIVTVEANIDTKKNEILKLSQQIKNN